MRQVTAKKQSTKPRDCPKELMVERISKDRRKQRIWKLMSNEELLEYAKEFMKDNGITGNRQLREADSGLHHALRKRKLLENVGFIRKRKKPEVWSNLTDNQAIRQARVLIRKNGMTLRGQLQRYKPGLYKILFDRGLIEKIGFEEKQRKPIHWSSMSDNQLIQFANEYIIENEVTTKTKLSIAYQALYSILRKRNLLRKIKFKQKRMDFRYWSSMTNDQIIQYAQNLKKEKGLTRNNHLKGIDSGLYEALRKRNLFSHVFGEKDQIRQVTSNRDMRLGLTQAAEAMEQFGDVE